MADSGLGNKCAIDAVGQPDQWGLVDDDPQRKEVSQGHHHFFPPSLPIVGYSRLPFLPCRIPKDGE
jgi:hypothetical protein